VRGSGMHVEHEERIARGEPAAGPDQKQFRAASCRAWRRVRRHSPSNDLFQTDSMPRFSASPLLWRAVAMTTKSSKSGIYLTDGLANSQWRMRIGMAGQSRGGSFVETQTRPNTHSELGVQSGWCRTAAMPASLPAIQSFHKKSSTPNFAKVTPQVTLSGDTCVKTRTVLSSNPLSMDFIAGAMFPGPCTPRLGD